MVYFLDQSSVTPPSLTHIPPHILQLAWHQGVSSKNWRESNTHWGVVVAATTAIVSSRTLRLHRQHPSIVKVVHYKQMLSLKSTELRKTKQNQASMTEKNLSVVYLLKLRLCVFTTYCKVSVLETKGLKRRSESGDTMLKVHNTKKQTKTSWYDRTFQRWWNCPPASSFSRRSARCRTRCLASSLLPFPAVLSVSRSHPLVPAALHLDNSLESQSSPSYSPSPCVAQVDWTCHCGITASRAACLRMRPQLFSFFLTCSGIFKSRCIIWNIYIFFFSWEVLTGLLRYWLRLSFSVSSPTERALGRSCLLANTSKTALFNSSSHIYGGGRNRWRNQGPDEFQLIF